MAIQTPTEGTEGPQAAPAAPFDLLQGFSPEQTALLRSKFTPLSVTAGELLIRAGDPGDCLYILRDGEVEVASPPPAEGGGRKLLARLGPGHVVGEMALLNREPRNADVFAVTDCKLDRLSAADYNALCGRMPGLKLVLTRLVAHRLSWSGSDVLARRIGSYTVLEPIGEGGMAWVYRAMRQGDSPDDPDRRVVALKMLPHSLVTRPGFLEQFRQEAAVMTGLRHENIVALYETIEVYGTMFLVLEYVQGSCLRDCVDRRGKLPPDEVWNIACCITQALRAAHARGVIHRDVKPDNIMARADGVMKLMDFGIAVPVSGPTVDLGGVAISPRYGAPEIFAGERGEPAADFYNLGVMLYELLAGRSPFTADTYEEWATAHQTATPLPLRMYCANVRPDLDALINATLVKNPAKRWAAVAPLLERLSVRTEIQPLAVVNGLSLPSRSAEDGQAVTTVAPACGHAVAQPPAGKPPVMMALWFRFPGEPKERAFLLTKPLVIGREAPADILIADASLSRRHLELSAAAGGLHVRDLGSSNGSLLNEQPVTEADLRQGDRLRIGYTLLTFERESATGVHFSVTAVNDA
jgi:Protein kinase domain/Cyclic nucleotide-binding domain/Inner membrane component of T3SS, cytoplasmic domain